MKTLSFKLNNETRLPRKIIQDAPKSGAFDGYADFVCQKFNIEMTLQDSISYLKEFGAWSIEELQDIEANKRRVLWQAVMYCHEQNTSFFYMGI